MSVHAALVVVKNGLMMVRDSVKGLAKLSGKTATYLGPRNMMSSLTNSSQLDLTLHT